MEVKQFEIRQDRIQNPNVRLRRRVQVLLLHRVKEGVRSKLSDDCDRLCRRAPGGPAVLHGILQHFA